MAYATLGAGMITVEQRAGLQRLMVAIAAVDAGPGDPDLASAPGLDLWSPVIEPGGMVVLWGRAEDHPILGADHITTSRLIAIDPGLAWARTASRWYRLRMPLSTIEAELPTGDGAPTGTLELTGLTRITDMERLQRLPAQYRAQIRKFAELDRIKHE